MGFGVHRQGVRAHWVGVRVHRQGVMAHWVGIWVHGQGVRAHWVGVWGTWGWFKGTHIGWVLWYVGRL